MSYLLECDYFVVYFMKQEPMRLLQTTLVSIGINITYRNKGSVPLRTGQKI